MKVCKSCTLINCVSWWLLLTLPSKDGWFFLSFEDWPALSTAWLHWTHTGSLWLGGFWLCRWLRISFFNVIWQYTHSLKTHLYVWVMHTEEPQLAISSENIPQHLNPEVSNKFYWKEQPHDLWSYTLWLSPTFPMFGQSNIGTLLMAYHKNRQQMKLIFLAMFVYSHLKSSNFLLFSLNHFPNQDILAMCYILNGGCMKAT